MRRLLFKCVNRMCLSFIKKGRRSSPLSVRVKFNFVRVLLNLKVLGCGRRRLAENHLLIGKKRVRRDP